MTDVSSSAPPSTRDALLLWGAIAVTVLLWASAFVGIRATTEDFGPGALTLGRIVVGSLALTVVRVVLIARRRRSEAGPDPRTAVPRGRLLLLVLGWGVAWFGVYNLALNASERHVDAGTAALLVNIAPMITAVLAGLLLGEGFPRRLLAGMLVALTGVAVIAFSTSTGQFDVIGVALGLVAAVVYGGAATLQKRLLGRIDAPTMTWLGCLAGTVACLPFAPELVEALAAAPLSSILAVVYLGIFPTAVAFTTWGYVLARSSAGRTAASTYAVPAVVVLLSWLVLGETPQLAALLGGALALAGVAVATLRRRPKAV
ncbi:EamA family transporter [Rathayibacter sp. AY1B7]|uniref:DMT family transporter n=1 Tax=Rathayibacter sp. AY1B7 TaxID=2080532 RepID=UPI000CE7AF2B|nr:DMT family transporter [Rathayibacter sp. AY1B7]PPI02207.1 EamA family transporter [Rathayibacter sp. AY1B7]